MNLQNKGCFIFSKARELFGDNVKQITDYVNNTLSQYENKEQTGDVNIGGFKVEIPYMSDSDVNSRLMNKKNNNNDLQYINDNEFSDFLKSKKIDDNNK